MEKKHNITVYAALRCVGGVTILFLMIISTQLKTYVCDVVSECVHIGASWKVCLTGVDALRDNITGIDLTIMIYNYSPKYLTIMIYNYSPVEVNIYSATKIFTEIQSVDVHTLALFTTQRWIIVLAYTISKQKWLKNNKYLYIFINKNEICISAPIFSCKQNNI